MKNVKVADDKNWVLMRGVSVKAINIVTDVCGKYSFEPTYQDHEFMKKSGYTRYLYEIMVKHIVIEKTGDSNLVKIYGHYIESQELMEPSMVLEMSNEEIEEWKQCDGWFETGFEIDYQYARNYKVVTI